MEAQTAPPPAYFAFKTLTNMVVRMEEHGPPNRIDRTFLTGMSGAGQTQFIAGLKSLGLIDPDGRVQSRLTELVNQPDDRPRIMGEILRERYPEAVELGETNATTGELVEIFRGYGVQGDTARKAIAFYLQAAKFAGDIPLSPNFKTPSVKAAPGAAKKRGRPSKPNAGAGGAGGENGGGLPTGLHPALAGLLKDLQAHRNGWATAEREQFKAVWDAMLDYAIPVRDDSDDGEWEEADADDE